MSFTKRTVLTIFSFLLLGMASIGGQAQERILRFDSNIQIHEDSSITVAETITVRAEGDQIRRGIYRDFITEYQDRFGNSVDMRLELLEVTRDGRPENFRREGLSNGIRLYLGRSDVFLEPGEYTYRLVYKASRMLGFFDEHDELYWNVTGNDWGFVIEKATATITLPGTGPVERMGMAGYTGPRGATGEDFRGVIDPSNARSTIETTATLAPREGLTVVVTWPKGIVAEPDATQQFKLLLADNRSLIIALAAYVMILLYYLYIWSEVGRDPESGVIYPRYDPPVGYSPAAAHYISEMGYTQKAFIAGIISLAVKGYLKIEKPGDDYVLHRLDSQQPLSKGEKVLYEKLFEEDSTLTMEKENASLITSAKSAHKAALRDEYRDIYFKKNAGYLFPPILVTLLTIIYMFATTQVVLMAVAVIVLMIPLHILFGVLLQAPTAKGRMLMDKLDGFRQYLEVAEKDDMNQRYQPEKTPELFEKYLPFAIALGVESAWASKFASVFANLTAANGTTGYAPAWYGGYVASHGMDGFVSDVSTDFSSAVSTASVPPPSPGSSSGMGGGGFSGGGGGGGGGGGW